MTMCPSASCSSLIGKPMLPMANNHKTAFRHFLPIPLLTGKVCVLCGRSAGAHQRAAARQMSNDATRGYGLIGCCAACDLCGVAW